MPGKPRTSIDRENNKKKKKLKLKAEATNNPRLE